MFKTTLSIALVSIAAIGLSACDVKKTQEGNVTLPKYDVTTPDVKVGTTEKTIIVPTVKTEEKKVGMPKVEIVTGKEKNEGKTQ
jgi:hypothetical protein